MEQSEESSVKFPNVDPTYKPLAKEDAMRYLANEFERDRARGLIIKLRQNEPQAGGVLNGEWNDTYVPKVRKPPGPRY